MTASSRKFVTNHNPVARMAAEIVANKLQRITCNVMPQVRHEILEGRQYMVVPMVMITEGVHAGSNGPLYYPSDELSKTPAVWNHKPIVVYHPTQNGEPISACEPAVISRRKIGMVFNTKWVPGMKGEPGKLKAEAWLDVEKMQDVDPRVYDAVTNGKMMEVSTGLFTDNTETPGLWKGREKYSYIARNYRPDHLAVLPDEKGACSIADGAGLLRNQALNGDPKMTKRQIINALITSNSTKWTEDDLETLNSFDPEMLEKMLPVANDGNPAKTVDSNSDDNSGQLNDSAGQVKPKKGGKKTVGCDNAMSEDETDHEDDQETDEDEQKNKQNNNSAQSVEEFIANAPEGVRELLSSGLRSLNANKAKLIKTITANKANKFTANYLATKDIEELEAIAALAKTSTSRPAPVANYLGAGEDVEQPPMVDNSEADDEAPLPLPTCNFQKVEE